MNKRLVKLLVLMLTALCVCPLSIAQSQVAEVPEEVTFTVTGFVVEGENPLASVLTQKTLAPFTGTHNGIERLQEAASALESVLRESGFGFYRVVLPPQDIGGVIKLQMFKFSLGATSLKGNMYFPDDNILRSLPQLQIGTSPNTQQLARDLAVANENPSKRANVTFKQGQVDDTIDANIEVVDVKPVGGFVALNNTGNSATGNDRVTAGISHSNLFGLDHQGTFTYTTSISNPGKVQQYGAYYRAPVYGLGGIVSAYFTTSTVDSGLVAGLINVTGRGDTLGVRYTHYFAPVADYRSFLTISLDDKNFLNDKITLLGGGALFPNYRTRPVTVSYAGRIEKKWGLWGYNMDFAQNLPDGSGNDSTSYNANRAGSSVTWNALRYGADVSMPMPANWIFSARLNGQISDTPLVPAEQFGVGGAQSVRGLEERVLSGDTGVQASVEFLTPPIGEGLRGLLFFDFGEIRRYNDLVLASATVSSLGFGARWSLGTNLSANLDIAHIVQGLEKLPVGTSSDKIHFSMNWRF